MSLVGLDRTLAVDEQDDHSVHDGTDDSAGLCGAVFDVGAENPVSQEAGNETSDGAK